MIAGITPENERFLNEQVAAGQFSTFVDALNAGIDLLKARQALIRRISISREQLDSGDFVELDDDGLTKFFDELRG